MLALAGAGAARELRPASIARATAQARARSSCSSRMQPRVLRATLRSVFCSTRCTTSRPSRLRTRGSPACKGRRSPSLARRFRHENTTDARRFMVSRGFCSCYFFCHAGLAVAQSPPTPVRRRASPWLVMVGAHRSGRSGALHRRVWRRPFRCGGVVSRWSPRAPNHSADPAARRRDRNGARCHLRDGGTRSATSTSMLRRACASDPWTSCSARYSPGYADCFRSRTRTSWPVWRERSLRSRSPRDGTTQITDAGRHRPELVEEPALKPLRVTRGQAFTVTDSGRQMRIGAQPPATLRSCERGRQRVDNAVAVPCAARAPAQPQPQPQPQAPATATTSHSRSPQPPFVLQPAQPQPQPQLPPIYPAALSRTRSSRVTAVMRREGSTDLRWRDAGADSTNRRRRRTGDAREARGLLLCEWPGFRERPQQCRGVFSYDLARVREGCAPPPPAGYCCAGGQVTAATRNQCRGSFFTDEASARKSCGASAHGVCCAGGRFRGRIARNARQLLHRRGECAQGVHGAAFTARLLLRRRQGFADHAGSLQRSLRARPGRGAARMPGSYRSEPKPDARS